MFNLWHSAESALSVRGPRTTHRTTGWHRSHPIINNYPAPYLRYFYNKTSREMTLLHSFLTSQINSSFRNRTAAAATSELLLGLVEV